MKKGFVIEVRASSGIIYFFRGVENKNPLWTINPQGAFYFNTVESAKTFYKDHKEKIVIHYGDVFIHNLLDEDPHETVKIGKVFDGKKNKPCNEWF